MGNDLRNGLRPDGVIFDCDGVLVDSEPVAVRILADSLTRHGFPTDPQGAEDLFLGGTLHGVADKLRAEGVALPADWVDRTYDVLYAELERGVPLVPGIARVLDLLDARGIRAAVGSNGQMRKMAITLSQHPELNGRFGDRVFSGQEIGAPKPDPALYLHAAAALGIAPDRAVVIDDSAPGCTAGVRAGIRTLGFAAHDDGARLAAVGAEVFHSMDDLPGLIGL